MTKPYTFRPIRPVDLKILKQWFSTPGAIKWWGEPDEELSLVEKSFDDKNISMQIVAFGDQEFAFVQDYDINLWPEPYYEGLPAGSRSLDVLIGVSSMIGRGHGSAFLRQRALEILESGVPVVAIDPLVENSPARRAYQKAGFVEGTPFEGGAGTVMPMFFEQIPMTLRHVVRYGN